MIELRLSGSPPVLDSLFIRPNRRRLTGIPLALVDPPMRSLIRALQPSRIRGRSRCAVSSRGQAQTMPPRRLLPRAPRPVGVFLVFAVSDNAKAATAVTPHPSNPEATHRFAFIPMFFRQLADLITTISRLPRHIGEELDGGQRVVKLVRREVAHADQWGVVLPIKLEPISQPVAFPGRRAGWQRPRRRRRWC